MALTITKRFEGVSGDLRYLIADVAFDSSYLSGGESLTAAMLGWDSIRLVMADAAIGYEIAYSYSDSLLHAYRIGIAASSIVAGANNTIVKNVAGTGVEVSGTGTAFQAVLSEVTSTNDMSTDLASVRIIVLGV